MKKALFFSTIIAQILLFCACAPATDFKSEADERLFRSIERGGDITEVMDSVYDGASVDRLKRGRLVSVNMVEFAAKNGRDEIAVWLLENGADVNYKTAVMGQTLLMSMAEKGKYSLCQSLLGKGADVTAKDRLSDTALEYAVKADGSVPEAEIDRLITLLLEGGAQIRRETLDAALTGYTGKGDGDCRYGIVRRVAFALREAGKSTGLRPWQEAAIFAQAEAIGAILDSGGISNIEQRQILFFSAAFGSAGLLRSLEDKGLDLKAADKDGNTLLSIAAKYENTEAVKFLLLSKSQNLYEKNRYGNTALDEAGNEDIKLLIEANLPAREVTAFEDNCTCGCCPAAS